MSFSFLILYPDVPEKALVVTSSVAFSDNYSLRNAFNGYYRSYARTAEPTSSLSLVFDLGSGNSRKLDYFLIGGISNLKSLDPYTVQIQGSNDGASWTSQLGCSSFSGIEFDGPDSDDLIFTPSYNDQIGAVLGTYRYFRVVIGVDIAAQISFKRLYFGQAFDMGKEPTSYDVKLTTERETDTWVYPRGHTIMSKAFYPKHTFSLTFDGVSDSKATQVTDVLLENPYKSTVYLYTQTYADPLYNNGLVLCRVPPANLRISKRNNVQDWNDVAIAFEEI